MTAKHFETHESGSRPGHRASTRSAQASACAAPRGLTTFAQGFGGPPELQRRRKPPRFGRNRFSSLAARDARGFTLIEVMTVMIIIVVLAGIGIAMYSTGQRRAREAALAQDLFHMRDAIDQYFADKNRYPPSLEALVTDDYLRRIPVDPMTNSADTWQIIMAEFDPGDPSAQPGIFDVKSGSDRQAMDGSRYADW